MWYTICCNYCITKHFCSKIAISCHLLITTIIFILEQIILLAKLLSTELPHIIHILVYIVTYVGENRTLDLFCQMISVWP